MSTAQPPNITIREATAADAERISRIAEICGLTFWNHSEYLKEIESTDSISLIATREGRLAGFIIGRLVPSAAGAGSDAEIFNVGTEPNVRRLGIGTKLLMQFLATLEKKEVNIVWLEVRAANDPAISYYRKAGFCPVSTRKNYYSAPREDAVVMQLILPKRP